LSPLYIKISFLAWTEDSTVIFCYAWNNCFTRPI